MNRTVVNTRAHGARRDPTDDDDRDAAGRREQDDLDREHEQLFHELRSIIPGAEVLFAFLLTVAFTERFQALSSLQRTIYFATFLFAAVSLLLLLAPSAFHRVRFRQRDKEMMLRAANVEAIAALILVSLSIGGTVLLITDLMFAIEVAVLVSVVVWCVASALWWGFPLARRTTDDGS